LDLVYAGTGLGGCHPGDWTFHLLPKQKDEAQAGIRFVSRVAAVLTQKT
jgi:hypothetical protein